MEKKKNKYINFIVLILVLLGLFLIFKGLGYVR